MKTLINIETQSTTIPDRLPGIDNPNADTLLANGWRYADPDGIPALADGYTRSAIRWEDSGDSVNAVAVYQDRLIAEITAEQQAAKMATFPGAAAFKFRELMRKHFGENAETNREVTADAVEYHFATATGLSGDDVRDGIFLKELFAKLTAWNGTDETWSLFETYGSLLP